MALSTWGRILQVAIVFFWSLALIMLALSSVSLDYPAYEVKLDRILANPADVAACEAEVALGNTGCVKDFYTSRAWKTLQWWVLYFTLPLMLFITIFVVIYLTFERGFWFFLMVIFLFIGLVWLIIAIIVQTIYWVNCKDYSACSIARYTYGEAFGVTSSSTDAWWIVHNVACYLLVICTGALFIGSIVAQWCFGRDEYEANRPTGIERLFAKGDTRTVAAYNDIGASLESQQEAVTTPLQRGGQMPLGKKPHVQ